MNEEQVAGIVEQQREHFRSNATLPLEARQQALRALLDAVRAHEDDIVAYAKRHLLMRDGHLIKDDRR